MYQVVYLLLHHAYIYLNIIIIYKFNRYVVCSQAVSTVLKTAIKIQMDKILNYVDKALVCML